eukprot:TRINITY_DN10432_c0_g1_i1.p1 TRINITY_DN10432_c0_g1~~TRINITY_DN10432_c0_g1_i1.p1  ORF type:complete len:169 (+),score=41.99 TRINITY_DN10432_c0_g1_i1:74-580(+)
MAEKREPVFENRDGTEVLLKDLRVWFGGCCAIYSLYCNFPEALGCKGNCEVCCFQCEETMCKCLDPSTNRQKVCVVCCDGRSNCIMPKTCLSIQEQICCFDCRCALPCTEEVPCLLNLCGINCCADKECRCSFCCQTVGELVPRLDDTHQSHAAKVANVVPVQAAMDD